MNALPLRIRYGARPLREAAAWLVPGPAGVPACRRADTPACGGPAEWLEEVLRWQVPHGSLTVRVIPVSRQDPRPRGALVTCSGGERPKVSLRCLPYGKVAGRLFVPVEAWFDPDVTEEELSALLGSAEYVFHPAAGLVAFERPDLLRLADLLAVDPPRERAWDRAEPGVGFARRLSAILPEQQPPDIEIFLREGRDDIGGAAGALDELPPTPDEPSRDPVSRAGRRVRQGLAKFVKWMTDQAPATAGKPTWVNKVQQWAERQLGKVRQSLDAARHRELLRLMRLLEKDPDRGLRYALPMGGGAHRGRGAPGDRLTRRDVDFSLGRLGGGAPADFWDMPLDYQQRLIARYRELADREARLGRHRRAAYIYAELLGDLDSAARALVGGRHFREAASLYRQRLNRPGDAARCLEQGGLWAEAVALYEELHSYEPAGDLYAKLDQPEDAEKMYRRAVERFKSSDNPVEAARVLEKKLHAPDEALAELTAGWPDSSQAGECLRRTFGLLGRLGRHAEARRRVEEFRAQGPPEVHRGLTVEILAETAGGYPDRRVQTAAADCTRVLAGRLLPGASGADARELVAAVGRLEPSDRLLGRDCHRYLRERETPRAPAAPRHVEKARLTLVKTFHLRTDVEWRSAIASDDAIFAAGFRGNEVVVVRCHPEGKVQTGLPQEKRWSVVPPLTGRPILLAAAADGDKRLAVHVPGSAALPGELLFPAANHFPVRVLAGAWWAGSQTVAVARTAEGLTWLVQVHDGTLVLAGAGPNGEPLTSRIVAVLDRPELVPLLSYSFPVPLHARDDMVCVGVGAEVKLFHSAGKQPDVVEVGQFIRTMAGSALHRRPWLTVGFEEGAAIFRGYYWQRREVMSVGAGLTEPVLCFTRGGNLVAAAAEGCEIYSLEQEQPRLKGSIAVASPPLAVLPLPAPDQFALFTENGELTIYRVP